MRNPYGSLMETIHLDDWDFLECPLCNPDLYTRSFERCENPMVPVLWIGIQSAEMEFIEIATTDRFDNLGCIIYRSKDDELTISRFAGKNNFFYRIVTTGGKVEMTEEELAGLTRRLNLEFDRE